MNVCIHSNKHNKELTKAMYRSQTREKFNVITTFNNVLGKERKDFWGKIFTNGVGVIGRLFEGVVGVQRMM